MDLSNKNIPQRTPTTPETWRELEETMRNVLKEILKESCPCHYPRFRYLIKFHHDNYNARAVMCADQYALISEACKETLRFLKLTDTITEKPEGDYNDLIYTCNKCSTVYKHITPQYSINFEFTYFKILEAKYNKDVGADVTFPFPLLQGLFGFKVDHILQCAEEFELSNANQVFNYLTEKA